MLANCPPILRIPAQRLRQGLAAFAGGVLALLTVPAWAQSQQSVDASVAVIEPLSITKLSDLDFGNIAGAGGGTVVLVPSDGATCTANGGIVHSGTCQAARFAGSGAAGQRLRIRRPVGRTITLTGPGEDMTVSDITFDAGTSLDPVRSNPNWERYLIAAADGTFIFRVGGTLTVNPDQAPGIYQGTFDIRVDYQ